MDRVKNPDQTILEQYNIHHREDYYAKAFSRNIGLLTHQEQLILKNARVAIPGLGGVGGEHLMTMVRSGVGKFNIADFDVFEPVNINRQYGATLNSFGRPKLDVMAELALGANPFLDINGFSDGVTFDNVDEFLKDVDVVLDGLDFFNFDIRRLLFNKAREKGIYVVTAAPLGFSSALLVFSPYEGMAFDDYFHIVEDMKMEDKYLAFAMGLAPRPTHIRYMDPKKVSLKSKAGPSLDVACLACASIAGSKAIQIILKKGKIKPVPHYIQFDPYLMAFKKGKLLFGNRNPLQRLKTHLVRYLLDQNEKRHTDKIPATPPIEPGTTPLSHTATSFLIQAGIQAPSGDNCQPWRFKSSLNTIDVLLDRSSDNSFFNVAQIASMISCGAVIENIKIAATKLGLQTRVQTLPKDGCRGLAATLQFSSPPANAPAPHDPLFEEIWKRASNRKLYSRSPIASPMIKKIKSSISDFPDAQLHMITERKKIKEMARTLFAVDQIRSGNRTLHEHLHQMLRHTVREAETKRDGMLLKNMEAGFVGELYLKLTRPWAVMRALNMVGVDKLAAFHHTYRCVLHSAGIGLLTIKATDAASFIEGGRALERIWLTLANSDISMQPVTAVTLFWLRWQLKGKEQFSPEHHSILAQAWHNLQKMFPAVNWKTHNPVMIFRCGQAQPPSTGTLRKDIADFIGS